MSPPASFRQHNLLSPGQAAEFLGVHRSTVWQYIESGQLASFFVNASGELTPTFVGGKRSRKAAYYRGVRLRDLEMFRKNYLQTPKPDSVATSKEKRRGAAPKKKLRKRAATNKR